MGAILRGQLREAGRARVGGIVAELQAAIGSRLRCVDDVYTAGDIATIIEQEQPDVVLVDHLGLVLSDVQAESDVSRFDAALGRIMAAIKRANTAGILINETGKHALKTGSVDLAASRGSARFGSLAAVFVGLNRIPPTPPSRDPCITAKLLKNRFGPTDCLQRARFFGGLSYFDWQPVEEIEKAT